jgi:uncharacterized protein (TIGR04255 family)
MAEANAIPKRLRDEPLLEAVWELRFDSASDSAAEALLAQVFSSWGTMFPKVTRLPAADVPLPMRQTDLRYVPTIRLEGPPYSVQVGERVVSLSCRRPYSGWSEFGERVRGLAKLLRDTSLITKPERFSLKYLDLLRFDGEQSLDPLTTTLLVGDYDLRTKPLHLRTEIEDSGYIHIIQVASPVTAKLEPNAQLRGVLLDIDTIRSGAPDSFWETFSEDLDTAHRLSKQQFFKLLKPATVAALGPEY